MSEMKRQSAVRLLPGLLWTLLNTHPWGAVAVVRVGSRFQPLDALTIAVDRGNSTARPALLRRTRGRRYRRAGQLDNRDHPFLGHWPSIH